MRTQIAPMLALRGGSKAIVFYKAAFGAKVLWRVGGKHNFHMLHGAVIEPFGHMWLIGKFLD